MLLNRIVYDSRYFPKCTFTQEREFFNILLNPRADRSSRLFLVGRMKSFGYCSNKVFWVIDKYNRWNGYSKDITRTHIECVFGDATGHLSIHQPKHSVALSPSEIQDRYFNNVHPWGVSPPGDIQLAVLYYHRNGGHTIPMRRSEKLPAVKWKEFQTQQPSLSLLKQWDFQYGLILLGTDRHCFLDIDIKSDKHPDGLEYFDESKLKGWTYERTKNGGYHVFGLGNLKSMKGKGVEIKGKGGYIVTYPTEGYKI